MERRGGDDRGRLRWSSLTTRTRLVLLVCGVGVLVALAAGPLWLAALVAVPLVALYAAGWRRASARRLEAFAELARRSQTLGDEAREREIEAILSRHGGRLLPSTKRAVKELRSRSTPSAS